MRRMLSLCVWGYVAINLSIQADGEKKFRGCHVTNPGHTECSSPVLQCNSDSKITIRSAVYGYLNRTEYSTCRCGLSRCDNCDETTREEGVKECFRNASDTDYWSLVSGCSFKTNCSALLPGKLNTTCSNVSGFKLNPSFTFIKYSCLQDSNITDFCSGTKSSRTLFLLYTSVSYRRYCQCEVKNTDSYTVVSLDMRNATYEGGGYYNLSFSSGSGSKSVINETVRPQEELLQVQSTLITLSFGNSVDSPDRIAIQIKGTNPKMVISCNETILDVTSKPTGRTIGFTDTTNIDASATVPVSTSKHTGDTTPVPASASKHTAETTTFYHGAPASPSIHGGGNYIAPVAGGTVAVIILVVAVFAVFLLYRKRYRSSDSSKSKLRHANPLYNEVSDNIYSLPDEQDEQTKAHDQVQKCTQTNKPAHFQLQSHTARNNYSKVNIPSKETYNQVTFVTQSKSTPTGQSNYDQMTTNVEDDCYNHLESEAKEPGNTETDYDTTASAARAIQEIENKEDYYSYDHLGVSKGTAVTDNDYDTAQPTTLKQK